LPGWQDSGHERWQSRWLAKYPNSVKVVQQDWMFPKMPEWHAIDVTFLANFGVDLHKKQIVHNRHLM